jgi:hypothetical protein
VNHFCTISTQDHLYKVSALAESLVNQGQEVLLHVLVVDSETPAANDNHCRYWKLSDLSSNATAQTIIRKYKANADKLRWSLKPVFLKYLLEQEKVPRLIYLDNDLFFYSDYQFLFDLLGKHSFLLTPHYYKHNPKKEQNWLEANFRVGLFNAGFVGVNATAIDTLQWWADCCIYRCEKNSFRGLFDDQKYLDLIPVMEETAYIVRHKGCNVAGWNTELCKREMINNKIKIDGKFPVVFIHFNPTTIRELMSGRDEHLANYYLKYVAALKKYKSDLKENTLSTPLPLSDKVKLSVWKLFTELGI